MFEGSAVANGITLKYKDFSDNEQTITLRAKPDSSKKTAIIWIVAMQKVGFVCFQIFYLTGVFIFEFL